MGKIMNTLHEYPYADINFPVQVIPNRMPSLTHDDELIYCHWHEFMEFILIEGGNAVVTVDSRKYEVSSGDLILVNPGEVHTAHATVDSGVVANAILFDPGILSFSYRDTGQEELISPLLNGKCKLPTLLRPMTPEIEDIIGQILELREVYTARKFGYELHIKACILKAVSLMAAQGLITRFEKSASRKRPDRTILLKGVLHHMNENYASTIRISELAAMAGLSEDHFYKAFKGLTGKTPVSYLNGYRVSRATELMASGGASVTEAAMETGFENISYFIRVFKRQMGMTPAKYTAGTRSGIGHLS